ncbi:hypothetical protein HZU40_21095 [Mycolicibacterium fluoranthenivorans]|uniref:Uncharacterized protein n=1 Tax=Mycolicibacterium fluoranthenivorans TaxID=258505 RepID=A0A7G8P8S2_9MYCO|nr:hypothetical protein [Mycolicibacterium fluoranthenivorans]QNJ90738.1 hypothetical protein HZU40_21095 [Mycolicibacterium fluoranthenivorans]
MTDRKYTQRNILEVTYDRLLTGFDGDGIVIGLADDDQGDTPVHALRWSSDDTAALLGDLLAFVVDPSGENYAGGQTRAYGLTRDGGDLVVLTPINADTVVAIPIPVAEVPAVIDALQRAQDGRDDLMRHDEQIAHADPDDFNKPDDWP